MWRILSIALSALVIAFSAGCGSGQKEPPEVTRSAPYLAFLDENSASLVRAIQAMLPELEHGRVARAQSRFARARVRYSQIEPAAEGFPELNARIDALPGEVPAGDLTGFHRIERALWKSEDTAGTATIAKQLIADTKQLEEKLGTARFSAKQLATGARRILDEDAAVKLANREQVYAGADLVDVSANLEAVGAAYRALMPALDEGERAEIRARLWKAYGAVDDYGTPARDPDQPRGRSPGAVFVVFDELSGAEVATLKRRVKALGAAFAELQGRLSH